MTIDELSQIGVARMDDGEIDDLLSRRGVGVLGLATADGPAPYLLPLSFGFDGDSELYVTYLHSAES